MEKHKGEHWKSCRLFTIDKTERVMSCAQCILRYMQMSSFHIYIYKYQRSAYEIAIMDQKKINCCSFYSHVPWKYAFSLSRN